VNLAIGHEHGAKLHLGSARELGASEDEIWETVIHAMRSAAANVRNFARPLLQNNWFKWFKPFEDKRAMQV